jgi:hypothetical protein
LNKINNNEIIQGDMLAKFIKIKETNHLSMANLYPPNDWLKLEGTIRINKTETFLSVCKNKDQLQIESTLCSNVVWTGAIANDEICPKLIQYNNITHFMKPEARRCF